MVACAVAWPGYLQLSPTLPVEMLPQLKAPPSASITTHVGERPSGELYYSRRSSRTSYCHTRADRKIAHVTIKTTAKSTTARAEAYPMAKYRKALR
jgi:hypothetical protein